MNRKLTTYIVVHHTVTPQSWAESQTMSNIKSSHGGTSPYHHVIGKDWTWSDSNQLEVKYHAGNYDVNLVSIAVSLVGNFVNDTLTKYQEKELQRTLEEWMKRYSIARKQVKLHREVRLKPTACPGNIDQTLITKLLTPSMTCEQQLSDEKRGHRETLERERDNYRNWQEELNKRKTADLLLAEEKRQHKETLDRSNDYYQKWQDALDSSGSDKFRRIKAIVEE